MAGLAAIGCDVNVLLLGVTADEWRERVRPLSRPIESDGSISP